MVSDKLPPAQPAYILRGHVSQIHAVHFHPNNESLLTGDADGWVVCWSMVYKRPTVVWRAHDNAVLGLRWWGGDAVISHGRDSKLAAWDLSDLEAQALDTTLPIDAIGKELKKPIVLHELALNTLNFCSFAYCLDPHASLPSSYQRAPLLLAVPHTLDSEAIDLFHLPTTYRLATLPAPSSPAAGMAMSLAMYTSQTHTLVIAGYESGHAIVWAHTTPTLSTDPSRPSLYSDTWMRIYQSNPHKQPILSLCLAPSATYFLTTSADAIVAKHPFDTLLESGVKGAMVDKPLKTLQTKHSGQQGLSVRNDGKVFATAGWDARVRVYSGKSVREVAVLKWHKDGCYATAFASVENESKEEKLKADAPNEDQEFRKASIEFGRGEGETQTEDQGTSDLAAKYQLQMPPLNTVAAKRSRKAQQTHWLAAGAKDGKVSLWDIF